MAVSMIGPKFYAWDRNGKPLAFGKLYTYEARTNIPKPTYQSEDQVVENTNPVILNGEGYANVYLSGSYKMVLKDDKDNEIWSSDPVSSNMADEWVHCASAEYLSPTSFKLIGNFTDSYTEGRKVRLDSNATEYAYSTISSSVFAGGETTVTVLEPAITTGILESCVSIVGQESVAFDYALVNDLSQTYNYQTVEEFKEDTTKFPDGKIIYIKERGAKFKKITGTSSATGGRIIASNPVDQSIELIIGDNIVNLIAFGVIGDGVTDDSDAIQEALTYSYENQISLKGFAGESVTSKTIYIGNYPNSTAYTEIDFLGLTILPDDSVVIPIDSGKLISGVWETAWNDPIETYMSFFTDLKNLKVRGSSDDAKAGRIGIRLKDWHYQCELVHIGLSNFETGFSIKHVFGLAFDQCSLFNTNSDNKTGQGFLLNDNVNLVKLSRCLSTNAEIGYNIFGGVSGVVFDNCSFEGQTTGVQFHDAVYSVEISNCYIENIIDTCFEFESQILAATFRNNYVNLSTAASANAYLFDFVELPNNNISFDSTNTILSSAGNFLPDDRYIKNMNLHTTYGYNRLELDRKVSELSDISELLIDNDNFPPNMDIKQIKETSGLKANVVNLYAKGNYSGKYSNGRDNPNGNGFEWINNSNSTMELRTRMTPSTSARIYLSLRVSGGTLGIIRGELIGDGNVNGNMDFYEYTVTGQEKTSTVTVTLVDGFYHLYYTHNATITAVVGEVRLS